ncbi:transcription initiation factor TFIID subunit 2-like [Papaver somniferum]|uniref:transcription initiation factor TFIID subunit 2-like n=1 Tax=Papaver somniferum TaxID=3469 RepID=UPI000E7043FE|nr:transcription initiation factor TFIID subunit 2-like [Papaver somniferum]
MEEVSLQGQVKLVVHAMRLCQLRLASESKYDIKGPTLLALLCMLESRKAFNNVFLRHHLFCILQLVVGRCIKINVIRHFLPTKVCHLIETPRQQDAHHVTETPRQQNAQHVSDSLTAVNI